MSKKEMEKFVDEFDTFQEVVFEKINNVNTRDTIKLYGIYKRWYEV